MPCTGFLGVAQAVGVTGTIGVLKRLLLVVEPLLWFLDVSPRAAVPTAIDDIRSHILASNSRECHYYPLEV